MTIHSLRLRLLETDFRIESEDGNLMDLLARLWAPFRSTQEVSSEILVRIRSGPEGWTVEVPDGQPWFCGDSDVWVPTYVVRYTIVDRALEEATSTVDLHAGAVRREGRALLLVGGPGVGKTTLTLALLRAGWIYLSDDRAPIDRASGQVHPFPIPLGIKQGSEWGSIGHLFGGDWPYPPTASFLIPASLFETSRSATEVAFLVFPQFQQDAPFALEPLSPGQAIALCSQQVSPLDSDSLDLLVSLCKQTNPARITYGRADEAIAGLQEWVTKLAGVS